MGKKKVIPALIWDQKSAHDFIKILDFISEESVTNAKRVKTRINNIIKTIPKHPYMFKRDVFKLNNNGNFRAFVKDKIRVSYQVTSVTIRIVRIRHTSREPEFY
jgi:plasmid stabilization system protein ParE